MPFETQKIRTWLVVLPTQSQDGRYRHLMLKENSEARADILNDLKEYVSNAHEDAKRFLQKGFDSLDPLDGKPAYDPAASYPSGLPMNALKGYFGEVFAAIVAEHFDPMGEIGWKVPTFLFRFHQAAFHELERAQQSGRSTQQIFGRIGDDCLAFRMDDDNVIIRSLVCEAKCTHGHNANSIREAHENLSQQVAKPVSLREMIEVLSDHEKPERDTWLYALRVLYLNRNQSANYKRYDMMSYVCGRSPKQKSTWIPNKEPHAAYTGHRRLEAVEIHLHDVDDLVRKVYNKPGGE